MPHTVLVFNPIAGGGRGGDVAARVEEELLRGRHTVERVATRDRRGAAPIAEELGPAADLVVAVGGDGTVREVVAGLRAAGSGTPIGVVPMGNANIVANELGIPRGADAAAALLHRGAPRPMDLGTARFDGGPEELFLGVVGLGWDADTVAILDRARHSPPGRVAYRAWADGLYGVAGAAAALRPAQPRFTVEADGDDMPGAYCAAYFCNLRTYGKGMAVTPEAHATSGRIHAQCRKRALAPFVVWQLSAALAGRRPPRWVSDFRDGLRFVARATRPVSVQIDGDARPRARLVEIGVEPGAIRIVAPA